MNTYVLESNQTRHLPVLRNLDKHVIKIIEHNRKDNMNTQLFVELSFEMQMDDDADGNPVFQIYHFSSRNAEFFSEQGVDEFIDETIDGIGSAIDKIGNSNTRFSRFVACKIHYNAIRPLVVGRFIETPSFIANKKC
jgi:hypothetical protein